MGARFGIEKSTGKTVAEAVADISTGMEEAEANARKIVEAMNAHDRLLAENARLREALESIIDNAESLSHTLTGRTAKIMLGWLRSLQEEARSALAGGEGVT